MESSSYTVELIILTYIDYPEKKQRFEINTLTKSGLLSGGIYIEEINEKLLISGTTFSSLENLVGALLEAQKNNLIDLYRFIFDYPVQNNLEFQVDYLRKGNKFSLTSLRRKRCLNENEIQKLIHLFAGIS